MDVENYETDDFELEDDEFENDETQDEDIFEEDSEDSALEEEPFAKDEEDDEKTLLKQKLRKLHGVFHRTATENQKLKEMLNKNSLDFKTMNDFSYGQAEENIKSQISQAKYEQEKALGEQNWNAFQKSIEDIARAASKLENLKILKNQEDTRQNSYVETPQEQPLDPAAQEWLTNNTWFDPESPDFDLKKHQEIDNYARKKNNYLIKTGRQQEIYGPAYLAEIDYVSKIYDEKKNGRAPTMKPQTVPVGAVRPTANNFDKGKPKKKLELTSSHKKIADSIGMSYAEYEKYVMGKNTEKQFR